MIRPGRAWAKTIRHLAPGFLWIAVAILAGGFAFKIVTSHEGGAGPIKPKGPDATVFISTLILIYTVFIAVYGALLPLILAKDNRDPWKWPTVVLIALAAGANLYRIQNSVWDLYTTTMGQLTPDQIHDAGYEFVHYYFYSNAVVIGIVLCIGCIAPRAGPAD